MFYSFGVSVARARTNAVDMEVKLGEFAHTHAYEVLRASHPHLSDTSVVVPALKTLAMGDGNAVDYAQEAHETMLKRAGNLQGTQIVGAEPLPRGPVWEMVTVDDHCGLQIKGSSAVKPCDMLFHASALEYSRHEGIEMHEGKTQWC
eukprot:1490875-Amphidinium_carterae.1